MNRVKFLVFALVALGLFGWSLKLAPSLGADRSTKDASLSLAGVPASLALRLESSRSELQSAMLKLGASNALTNPGPKAAKVDPPTADRFNAVRAAATDGASEALKASLVVVVSNEAGALVAQGAADGAAAPEGFDVAAVNAAGGAGALVTVFGAPHLFYALPMVISDKNEVKSAGLAAVGAPLVDPKTILTGFKAELHLDGVALLADGKIVAVDGDKAGIEGLIKSVKAGVITPVNEGAVEQVGPIALPMMSSLTQELALRRPITGTPFEVLATVSSADDLIALAGFQKFGLGALIGLLLLSIAVTALIKSGEEEGASMVMPPPLPAPPSRSTIQPALVEPTPAEATPHHGPEASPDDFNFPASPQPSQPPPPRPVTAQAPVFQPEPQSNPFEDEPAADPFASLAPSPAPPPAPAAPPSYPTSRPPPPVQTSNQAAFQPTPAPPPAPPPARNTPLANPFDDEEGARTMAYPVFKPAPGASPNAAPPAMDPFAMASAQLSPEEQSGGDSDYNPDATRVAAVPAELIKAARQTGSSGHTGERQALSPKVTSAAPKVSSVIAPASPGLEEERHFQDVFKEFVATRERCKEPADGLTYDKFKAKLLKNKEQLVQKYNCKSVRFQVYVKDGKAALKATPVKE